MSKKQFLGLEVENPGGDEQRAIAEVLCEMDPEIDALEQRSSKTADVKLAMMQEPLTGLTRHVSLEVAHA